ncbi:pyridoxamine 5'-phosphate oxidase family protein [Mesorhizobium sp. AR07]|uniref:pyridoxamine 5'-phosphate oxidase family protein n=1 Tax=Mesorhizobium sp. AR07 TaxID=2865838 RepID=UPI00215F6F0C|nr:pyridoxamine 5'-phosphate oxidase family protein [Mesorhizobium sp. AR07]UVK46249.1 pyridoxamine 5'-phosphate oxidase family protein [Mesorhizobium sp. AR07]
MNVKVMTRQDCVALLKTQRLGRLACVRDLRPYVVPIHFAFGDNSIFSFSLPGRKVEWMQANPQVCLQVDDVGGSHGWKSVVVEGLFEELPKGPHLDDSAAGVERMTAPMDGDRKFAWSLLAAHANWWEPGALKPGAAPTVSGSHLFYQIRIEAISGRQASW